jgi:micrococcal nuclease
MSGEFRTPPKRPFRRPIQAIAAAGLMAMAASGVILATKAEGAQKAPSTNSYVYDVIGIYDGDTFYIRMEGLPVELQRIGVRVRGIDTAEMKGKCEVEKRTAAGAKLYTTRMLKLSGNRVTLRNLKWDKYGGRVDADVFLANGQKLADNMIMQGYARPYKGGKRAGWCQ